MMSLFYLFLQGGHLIAWLVVLIGAILFLRRRQAVGGVLILLGAASHVMTSLGYGMLSLTGLLGMHSPTPMHNIMVALAALGFLGTILFAVGFLLLALAPETAG